MRKNLLALSVLAVITSASAQSSVTLFGVVDIAVSRYSVKSEWYNKTANPFLLPPGGKPRPPKEARLHWHMEASRRVVLAFAAPKISAAAWQPASGSKARSILMTDHEGFRTSTVARRSACPRAVGAN